MQLIFVCWSYTQSYRVYLVLEGLDFFLLKGSLGDFPGGSVVKNPGVESQMQETWVRPLDQEARTCLRMTKLMHLNYLDLALEPRSPQLLSPCTATAEAREPWSPFCARTEAATVRSPCPATREYPPLLQPERSLHRNTDPAQPKINKWNYYFKKEQQPKDILKKIEGSLGFPTMSSANRNSFSSSFPVYLLFFILLHWLELPILRWKTVVRADIIVLFLNNRGKTSIFHHHDARCLFFFRCYLSLRKMLLNSEFDRAFFMNGWIFFKCFFCISISIWFFFLANWYDRLHWSIFQGLTIHSHLAMLYNSFYIFISSFF